MSYTETRLRDWLGIVRSVSAMISPLSPGMRRTHTSNNAREREPADKGQLH